MDFLKEMAGDQATAALGQAQKVAGGFTASVTAAKQAAQRAQQMVKDKTTAIEGAVKLVPYLERCPDNKYQNDAQAKALFECIIASMKEKPINP